MHLLQDRPSPTTGSGETGGRMMHAFEGTGTAPKQGRPKPAAPSIYSLVTTLHLRRCCTTAAAPSGPCCAAAAAVIQRHCCQRELMHGLAWQDTHSLSTTSKTMHDNASRLNTACCRRSHHPSTYRVHPRTYRSLCNTATSHQTLPSTTGRSQPLEVLVGRSPPDGPKAWRRMHACTTARRMQPLRASLLYTNSLAAQLRTQHLAWARSTRTDPKPTTNFVCRI